ncbi:MAG: ATP-binding protein [Candidatus Micrarchaeia archaeon]
MKEFLKIENIQWEGRSYEYPKKRKIIEKLKKEIKNKLIISIEGPRRVGKSVLMRQLIDYLIKNGELPVDILYHSFDEYYEDPLGIIKEYERIRGKSLREGKIYFFFDEIQKIKEWQKYCKVIYDNYPNSKIVISGSTLRGSKKENLAGRMIEFFIKPLSFEEYLDFSERGSVLKTGLEDGILEDYNFYLFRQYPDLILDKNINPREYVSGIIKKVIFEDSILYLENPNKELLHSLIKIILRDPGQIMGYTDLAKDFGSDRKTISEYLEFLIKSSLVRRVYNYSNNARKTETKAKKFYPFCTTLAGYIELEAKMDKIIETDVAFQIDAEFFYNERNEEIDFIIKNGNVKGIEVKYRNIVDRRDVKNLYSQSAKKIGITKRYLIVKENSRIDIEKKDLKIIKYYLVWKNDEITKKK